VESFTALWEIFAKIVSEAKLGTLVVLVDAIDECEANTRRTFLRSVKQFVEDSQRLIRRPRNCVKFFITSRPSIKDLNAADELKDSILAIDDNPTRISHDVKLVIKERFQGIAKNAGFSEATRIELEELLYSKAEKSFLWLNIVLHNLEDTPSTSNKDMQRIINRFPRKLEETSASFVHNIPEESQEKGRDILSLLVGSSRHFSLDEINVAYTIYDDDYKSVAQVDGDRQFAIDRMLQAIVGPFVRIESSKMSLIHQSVKEFLVEFAPRSPDPTIRNFGFSQTTAALTIATACIRYLLLDDFAVDVFVDAHYDSGEKDMGDGSFANFFSDAAVFHHTADFDEQCSRVARKYTYFDYAAMNWAKHFAACEDIASEQLSNDVKRLISGESFFLNNWLKYFWANTEMEFMIPDNLDIILVAAFFDFSILLEQSLQEKLVPVDQAKKDRALFWAARAGCLNSAKVRLKYGADPNAPALYRHTPLTIASHHGHMEVVKALISDARCNINAKGKSGRSALSFAAGSSHLEVFEFLFKLEDCRPEEPDENGWIPLFWAIERDHTTIARTLLRHPTVDINNVDRDGRSALSWAAGEGFVQALRMLLAHPGVDVNIRDSKGRSPLLWAANNGQEDVIDILMQDAHGVDPLSKDNDHRTALSLACGGGHTNTIKALIKYGCGGENEEGVDGWTPLAWALDRRSPETVEALLSGRGIDLDHRDSSGRTALIWAVDYGYPDVVQMLLAQGADPGIATERGRVAMDFAKELPEFHRGEIMQLLEEAMVGMDVTAGASR
jgi:ankyrin repeat protein